jgi:hypothetical protein
MKKLGSLLAILVMFGFLAACGTDDSGANRARNNTGSDAGTDIGADVGDADSGSEDADSGSEDADSGSEDADSGADTCTGPGCGSSGDVCAADEDCTAPEICTADRSGDSFEFTCQNPGGGGDLGDSCSADSECASNLCVDSECSTPCERPSDCSDDGSFICETSELPTDGGATEEVDVCVRKPASECASNADCTSPEQCVATKTATEVIFECGSPNSGGAAVGESCSADADCTQNLCQGATCSAPCAADGDCSAADGYSCEIESVDLGSGNSENAQICTAPRACSSRDDCQSGEVCHLDRTTGNAFCRPPNASGGELGDRCTGDVSCSANLCNEERFGDVCTVACVDDGDCTKAGYECGTASVDDGSGATTDVSVCVAEAPTNCTSNDDCASGLNCSVVPNAAQDALETICVPTSGGKATGVSCTDDDECASLVCINSACSVPCTDTNQCAGPQLCQSNNVSKDGLNGTFDMCETLLDERCDATGTCSDGVRMCNEVRVGSSGSGREAYCGMTNAGAPGGLGDHCSGQSPQSECRSNVCFNGTSDECTVICADDSQCGAGQICSTFELSGSQLGYCISGCTDNGDCAGLGFTNSANEDIDHVCATNENTRDDDVDQICVRRLVVDPNDDQVGLLGDTCQSANDCQSGLCLTNTIYDGTSCSSTTDCQSGQVCEMSPSGVMECGDQAKFCTSICDDGSDCSGGIQGNTLTTCDPGIRMTLSTGTVDTISACSPN